MVFKYIVGPEGQKAHWQVGIDVGNKAAQRFDLPFVDLGDHQDSVLPEFVFKNGAAFRRGGVKGCGSHCRHCNAADPGLTLKAVDAATMLTQCAMDQWLQVIFLAHIVIRA